jgi:uncharacterized protein (TIGR03437 family)
MKTSAWMLLLLTLGARTAYADQGYAYAWVPSGTATAVSATYSFNPAGGAITLAHSATGSYTVTFANSGIGTGWVAMAAAYGGSGNYCNTPGWAGSVVTVSCFNAAGAAADTAFTVLAVSNQNDKGIAFSWANNSTSASYTPSASYSYNPAGSILATRSATGTYQVVFNGLSGAGGTVQVNAYGSNAVCSSADWGGSFMANVNCHDPSGNPVDSLFVIAIVPAGATPNGMAWSLAASPASPSYTPPGATTFNPTGGAVSVSRQGTGQYLVTFAKLAAVGAIGGLVRATANDTTAHCNVQAWSPGAGGNFQVSVGCTNGAGTPVDAQFEVLALPPAGYAYAWIQDGTTADVPPNYAVNPGGAPVTATHDATGRYTVTFPKSGIGPGWDVQVNAYGTNATWCKVGGWGGNAVSVLCFNAAGTAVDGTFTVLAVSSTNGKNIAFAWADQPTASSYTANANYAYNPAGAITISRASTGSYAVVFKGLDGSGGTVQITAYGTSTASCYSNGWETPDFEADVICIDPNGTQVDTPFTVALIPAHTTPLNIAYAWANQPTAGSYNADATYAYNPLGGAVTITRSAAGMYQVTFKGFNSQALTGGDVRVTSYSTPNAPRCKVNSWVGSPDFIVTLHCNDRTGALADAEYQVLVFGPELGTAAQISAKSGSGQSAATGAAFANSLVAAVTDVSGNPIPGIQVTFTAPGSGASGTFAGGATTATVGTDSGGLATAPAFTANSTAGSYQVTASFLSAATPAAFALTNTGGTGTPTPTITKVANAEGEVATIAPNTWVEIKGTNLSPPGDTRIWGSSDFVNNTLPTALDGVHATVNGIAAFVYFISPTQVNVLTPPDALPGTVQVVVTVNGTPSAPFSVAAAPLSTSFFVFNGGPYVAAVHLSGGLIGPVSLFPGATTPAQPEETFLLFANGFGPTSLPIVSGSETQSGTLSPLPVVTIGGIQASVGFAGLVFPGEFQFNVTIPTGVANGDQPIVATYNGATTQAGTLITIQKP